MANIRTEILFARGVAKICLAESRNDTMLLENAIMDLNLVLQENLDDDFMAKALYNRGIVWLLSKEYKKALEDFNSALRLDSQYADAMANRGHTRCFLEDYDGAIKDFERSLEWDPDNHGALLGLAEVMLNQKEFIKAKAALDRDYALNPNDPATLLLVGKYFYYTGITDRAGNYFRLSLEKKSNYAEALSSLGMVQASQGLLNAAEESYRKAIDANHNFPNSYYNLANLKVNQGINESVAKEEAVKLYETAARLGMRQAEGAWRNLIRGMHGQSWWSWWFHVPVFSKSDIDKSNSIPDKVRFKLQYCKRRMCGQVLLLGSLALIVFAFLRLSYYPADTVVVEKIFQTSIATETASGSKEIMGPTIESTMTGFLYTTLATDTAAKSSTVTVAIVSGAAILSSQNKPTPETTRTLVSEKETTKSAYDIPLNLLFLIALIWLILLFPQIKVFSAGQMSFVTIDEPVCKASDAISPVGNTKVSVSLQYWGGSVFSRRSRIRQSPTARSWLEQERRVST